MSNKIQYDGVELDNLGICKECGQDNILDGTIGICFDCWCILDLKVQESEQDEEE